MKKWAFKTLAWTTASITLVVMAALMIFFVSGGHQNTKAATGDYSYASGQFLSGSLLGIDEFTGGLAVLNGAEAEFIDGTTPPPNDTETSNLDLALLQSGDFNLLNITLSNGLSIPLGELLSLGVAGQYAQASPDGQARAAAGAVDSTGIVDTTGGNGFPSGATLDLTAVLPGIIESTALSAASLELGAITSAAQLSADSATPFANSCTDITNPVNCRDYAIASADLRLQSPLVGVMTQTVDGAIKTLDVALDTLVDGLVLDLVNELGSVLSLGTDNIKTNVSIHTTDLDDAVAGVLTRTFSTDDGGVSIDLSTGEILLDLEELADLNNLDPNTQVLSPEVIQHISQEVADLLAEIQGELNAILLTALDNVSADIEIVADLGLAGVEVTYEGSLQDLLTGDQLLNIEGTGLLSILGGVLDILPGLLQGVIGNTAMTAAQNLLTVAGNTIDGAITVLTDGLSGVFALLNQVVSLEVNVQDELTGESGTAYSVTALEVALLPLVGDLLTIDLATSIVGPNNHQIYNTTLSATDNTISSGPEQTTVTGGGWPANTEVTLVVYNSTGAEVTRTTTTTDASGNLSQIIPLDGQEAGDYRVEASTAAGETNTANFQINVQGAPVINQPLNNSFTKDNNPTISGTGEAGFTVTVTPAGNTSSVICTAVVAANGTWTCDTDPVYGSEIFPDGTYNISATQEPAGGGEASVPSNTVTFTVDTTPPEAPEIVSPADGSTTTERSPEISGQGMAGKIITVTDANDNLVCSTTIDENGDWACTPSLPMAIGAQEITATITDPVGNEASDTNEFTIAPPAPTITPIASAADGTPTISGTGLPGATVTVTEGGTTLCTATVRTNGTWSCTPSTPLATGDHEIAATQTVNETNSAPATADFTIEALAAPVIGTPADGATITDTTPTLIGTGVANSTLNLYLSDSSAGQTPVCTTIVHTDGAWSCTLAATQALGDYGAYTFVANQSNNDLTSADSNDMTVNLAPEAPVISSPQTGMSTTDLTPYFDGTGIPGATVSVYLDDNKDGEPDGAALCSDLVALDGTWSCSSGTLGLGEHTFIARQVDDEFTSPNSTPVTVTVVEEPAPPTVTAPAAGATITDPTPYIYGTGEPGAMIEVEIDGEVVCDGVMVSPGGIWSCTVADADALTYDVHVMKVTQRVGNIHSIQVHFTVALAPPTITQPINGNTYNSATVTVTGTAIAGSTINLTATNTDTSTTITCDPSAPVANAGGIWTCDLSNLTNGNYSLSATQTTLGGDTSDSSNLVSFVVNHPPAAPVIISPTGDEGNFTTDTVTVNGAGVPGATVNVTSGDNNPTCTTIVNSSGTWSCNLKNLEDGPYTISATQTTASGTSPADTVDITVDVPVPSAPKILIPTDGENVVSLTPVIFGTGTVGNLVTVKIDGTETVLCADVLVTSTGSWSCMSAALAEDTTYTISATQVYPTRSDDVSPKSNLITFHTNATANISTPPTIEEPDAGDTVTDATPEISGTGTPGNTVIVSDDTGELCRAEVDAQGDWSCSPSAAMTDGEYTISAVEEDPDHQGEYSEPSEEVTFTVDAVPDNTTNPTIEQPTDEGTVNTLKPEISGTATDGNIVTVRDGDNNVICVDDTVVAGQWSCVPTTDLVEDKTYTIIATQVDPTYPDDNSSQSAAVTFTVDSMVVPTVPKPEVSYPTETTIADDEPIVVTGTGGVDGNTITVVVTDNNNANAEVATCEVVATGDSWTCTLDSSLPTGDYTLTAIQSDGLGNDSVPDNVAVTVEIEDVGPTVPEAPVITAPTGADDLTDSTVTVEGTAEPGAEISVSTDVGDHTCTATADSSGNWSCDLTDLTNGDYTISATQTTDGGTSPAATVAVTVAVPPADDYIPTVNSLRTPNLNQVMTGKIAAESAENDTISVYHYLPEAAPATQKVAIAPLATGTLICTSDPLTPADIAAGTWSCDSNLPYGVYRVVANQTPDGGQTSGDSARALIIVYPPKPTITSPGSGETSDDPTPTISGTGEADAEITVEDENGNVICETTVGSDGTWTCEADPALTDGEHTLTATQTVNDAESEPSDPITVTIDAERLAPPAPTITSPAPLADVADTTPVFTGTGLPGHTVTVTDDKGQTVCTATVDTEGNWTCESQITYGYVGVTVTATQADSEGRVSLPSDPVEFAIIKERVDPVFVDPNADKKSDGGGGGSGNPSAPQCTAQKPGDQAPYIYKATSDNNRSITLHFNTGSEPFNKYLLQYGYLGEAFTFGATINDPKAGQFTINDLTPGKSYQFQIIPMNDCAGGPSSNIFPVGLGGGLPKVPGVPNTGFRGR